MRGLLGVNKGVWLEQHFQQGARHQSGAEHSSELPLWHLLQSQHEPEESWASSQTWFHSQKSHQNPFEVQ